METYSLIVMTDATAPVRRFDVTKPAARRALQIGSVVALLLAVGLIDYVRLRIDQLELDALRGETVEQRERIGQFEATLSEVDGKLAQLREFERKVRIIANLPGSAGSGGPDVTAAAEGGGDLEDAGLGAREMGLGPAGSAEGGSNAPSAAGGLPPRTEDERLGALHREAERLEQLATLRNSSLEELVGQLEEKHHHLASSPAIWPAKGWLTSRFGYRISPFTSKRQFHSGIDIAGRRGTNVLATARGTVKFAARRGPLGNSVVIDHGYGIETHYGHVDEILVKRGQQIERGQVVASLGNSGRSTGPHLHYTVQVNGKAVNPLDYIFD